MIKQLPQHKKLRSIRIGMKWRKLVYTLWTSSVSFSRRFINEIQFGLFSLNKKSESYPKKKTAAG